MVRFSAPGKLFLSGEWAVLEVGNPGIVAAVNKRVHAALEPGEGDYISVTIDDFGIKDLRFSWDRKELKVLSGSSSEKDTKFLRASVETSLKFLHEKGIDFKPFKIRTWGDETSLEVNGERKKIGFGSSAASVVAVVGGILEFHGFQASKEEIYKIAAITHYFAQGKVGSAFDVAASAWGGVFVYKRFDASWLVSQVDSGRMISEIVSDKWPGLEVEALEIPEGFDLLVGWTKESASSSAMVKQMNSWSSQNPEDYKKSYDMIAGLVKELIPAWKSGDKKKVIDLLRYNETLLRELGEKSGVEIETPELRKLSEMANSCGGAGKLSGAGGGDCGIAVSFSPEISEKVKSGWKDGGFYLIDVSIDKEGFRRE